MAISLDLFTVNETLKQIQVDDEQLEIAQYGFTIKNVN